MSSIVAVVLPLIRHVFTNDVCVHIRWMLKPARTQCATAANPVPLQGAISVVVGVEEPFHPARHIAKLAIPFQYIVVDRRGDKREILDSDLEILNRLQCHARTKTVCKHVNPHLRTRRLDGLNGACKNGSSGICSANGFAHPEDSKLGSPQKCRHLACAPAPGVSRTDVVPAVTLRGRGILIVAMHVEEQGRGTIALWRGDEECTAMGDLGTEPWK